MTDPRDEIIEKLQIDRSDLQRLILAETKKVAAATSRADYVTKASAAHIERAARTIDDLNRIIDDLVDFTESLIQKLPESERNDFRDELAGLVPPKIAPEANARPA